MAEVWHAPAPFGGYCGAVFRETKPRGEDELFVYVDEAGELEFAENSPCPLCGFGVGRYNVEPACHARGPLAEIVDPENPVR